MKKLALFSLILLSVFVAGCHPTSSAFAPPATATVEMFGLSADEYATLSSLEQLDDYPLYTMHYAGAYATRGDPGAGDQTEWWASPKTRDLAWGCSLFAALGDEQSRLYGRNFDWEFSPALLLFTDPPDGYASVSMVDIAYLGFGGERSKNLAGLPLDQRKRLLEAPFLPFDGMNEMGLAIGMAAVPAGDMIPDPRKETVGDLMVMREILDHASTVEQAIQILGRYNIDMSDVPIHYLVASAAGESALVEFYRGEMVVHRNQSSWQHATNFLVAEAGDHVEGNCQRYDLIQGRLEMTGGRLATQKALNLLAEVSQPHTQWSVVYEMTSGAVNVIMGRDYEGEVHSLRLK